MLKRSCGAPRCVLLVDARAGGHRAVRGRGQLDSSQGVASERQSRELQRLQRAVSHGAPFQRQALMRGLAGREWVCGGGDEWVCQV